MKPFLTRHEARFDVVAFDDAFGDKFYDGDVAYLAGHGLKKGQTEPMKPHEAHPIVQGLAFKGDRPGGGGANSMVALSKLGGKACFVTPTGTNEEELAYQEQLRKDGVTVVQMPVGELDCMGTCHVIDVEDDRTQLPVALRPPIDHEHLKLTPLHDTKITFVQGYFWTDARVPAIREAMHQTRAHGGKTAFCLSSEPLVAKHRQEFLDMLGRHDLDILFGNEEEINVLTGRDDFEKSKAMMENISRRTGTLMFITRKEKGSLVIQDGVSYPIAPVPGVIVDSACGAGDAYAGAVLYGLTSGKSITEAAEEGSRIGAKVVARQSARLHDEDVPGHVPGRQVISAENMERLNLSLTTPTVPSLR